jgi:3alpha(or 20beta)-hydroxysteroid dehydrogenase
MRLAGKVALVTGGAHGMGASEAALLAKEGAKVMVGDVLEAEGREVVARIAGAGGQARFARVDVTSEADWRAVVAATEAAFGKLDVLVNNAGIVNASTLRDYALADWQRIIDVNLTGTFLGMQSVIDPMIDARGGSMINISSIEGMAASPLLHAYIASKFAVRGITK